MKTIAACVLTFITGTAITWSFLHARPHQIRLVAPKDDDLVVINGCVVTAFDYLAAVEAAHKLKPNFWARVMLVRYENYSAGHAYCVWESGGRIYGYDRNSGGFPIPGHARDPVAIAQSLSSGISGAVHKDLVVKSAEFIEPRDARVFSF